MGDLITLPKPTRTEGDADLGLGPCGNAWGPIECPHAGYWPGPHVCWTWTGWPHICRCMRCAGGAR